MGVNFGRLDASAFRCLERYGDNSVIAHVGRMKPLPTVLEEPNGRWRDALHLFLRAPCCGDRVSLPYTVDAPTRVTRRTSIWPVREHSLNSAAPTRLLRPWLAPAGVGLLFVARGLPFLGFIPIWDGWFYAQCVIDAVAARSFLALNCANHTTAAYMALLAIPQLLAFGAYQGFLLVNLALGLAAIWAFYRTVRRLFPKAPGRELMLLCAAFSSYPVLLAGAVNPSPDYGVFVFFCLTLFALIHRYDVLTVVFGVFLALSKETGVAFYVFAVIWYEFAYGVLRLGTVQYVRRRLPGRLVLIVPAFIFAVVYLALSNSGGEWAGTSPSIAGLGSNATSADLANALFRIYFGYLAGGFMIQFSWIMLVFILIWAVRSRFRLPLRDRAGNVDPDGQAVVFAVGLLLSTMVSTLWYPTFANDRYLLPFFPVFCIVAYRALKAVVNSAPVRQVTLATWCALLLVSNVVTVDPVARLIYGTFRFGDYEMLDRTSLTGECCGLGRDQLVYNLQFTAFHYVQNEMLQSLKPSPSSVLLAHKYADWMTVERIDTSTFLRTMNPHHSRDLRLTSVESLPRVTAGGATYFVNYPNFRFTPEIREAYGRARLQTFGWLGYRLDVYEVLAR